MNFARHAISKAVQAQSLSAFLERGVLPQMIPDAEDAKVLEFLYEFWAKHKAVPSPSLVQQKFPTLTFLHSPDPMSYYVQQLLEQFVRSEMGDLLVEKGPVIVGATDPQSHLGDFRTEMNRLQGLLELQRLTKLGDGTQDRLDAYLDRKSKMGMLGIPTYWDSLTQLTRGWQPHTYNIIAARPKVGKTMCAILQGESAIAHDKKVLFSNKEMPDAMMNRRVDAVRSGIGLGRFLDGALTDKEYEDLKKMYAELDANPPPWWWLNDVTSLDGLEAKIVDIEPDLVIIDGAYLLDPPEQARTAWERQQNISRGIKRIVSTYPIPVIVTLQLNRDADPSKTKGKVTSTSANIAGSDAFLQDADNIFSLKQDLDDKSLKQLNVTPEAMRESEGGSFRTKWDFSEMDFKDLGFHAQILEDDDEEFVDIGDDDDD